MTPVKIKLLMVDVDGVLVQGRPADGLPLFTYLERDLGVSLDVLRQEFFKPYWPDIVTGREAVEPRLADVLRKIAPHISAETLLAYWFENDSRLDQVLLADLARLKSAGTRLCLATNQEHRRAAFLMEQLNLAQHFDGIFYSAGLGHKKPSADFFRLATERAGMASQDIGFIDDSIENIEAARDFGWAAVQWLPGMTIDDALAALEA